MRMLTAIAVARCGLLTPVADGYRGDGKFVDRGWPEADNRYVLDLGAVNLSPGETRTYTLTELPNTEYTVGLELASLNGKAIETTALTASIHIRLVNERNEVVVDVRSSLSDWMFSHSVDDDRHGFFYIRGPEGHVPTSDSAYRVERRNVRADGG